MIKVRVTVYCNSPGCLRATAAEVQCHTVAFRGEQLLASGGLLEFPPDENGNATGWTPTKCPDHRVKQ